MFGKMAFEQRPEGDKRVSWAAVWKSGSRGGRSRDFTGTEVEEGLASVRNRRKTTGAGSEFAAREHSRQ